MRAWVSAYIGSWVVTHASLVACRWMGSLADGKAMPGSCTALMRKAAEAGAKDKSVEIREAAQKLSGLCASNQAPEVRFQPAGHYSHR